MTGQPMPWEGVELVIFDGEDAYEGLVAIVFMVYREDGVDLDSAKLNGFIVDADYPPSEFLAE